MMDGTVVMVDRDDHKVKEFKEDLNEVRVLAGSGRSGTKDGSKTSASFSQPTAVCCEKVLTQFKFWILASVDLK